MDAIPPTKAALVHNIKRTIFQGGHCWDKTTKFATLPEASG